MVGHASSSLTAGQADLIAALIEYFKISGNPLRKLRNDVYPAYLRTWPAPKPRYRRYYGEPIPEEPIPEPPSPLDQLNDWARESEFIAIEGDGTMPAQWVIDWAAGQFPLDTKWPMVQRYTPWWRRVDPPPTEQRESQEDLGNPEPIPIVVAVTIPVGATTAQATDLFRAEWGNARGHKITKVAGQPGRPGSLDPARYLALRLCGWNRVKITEKFNVIPNTISQGQRRAAAAAGIRLPVAR